MWDWGWGKGGRKSVGGQSGKLEAFGYFPTRGGRGQPTLLLGERRDASSASQGDESGIVKRLDRRGYLTRSVASLWRGSIIEAGKEGEEDKRAGRKEFFCVQVEAHSLSFLFHIISSLTDVTMAPSTIKLASGHEMPLVGFGLWKVPADQAAETVYNVCASIRLPSNMLTSCTGHQGWLPTLRRSVRLPEREGGWRGYQARHQRGPRQA